MAIQRQFLTVLAQHEQTGGVVNLRVQQQDSGNASVAQSACRLQSGKRLDLLQYIRGRVDQQPIGLVGGDRNR